MSRCINVPRAEVVADRRQFLTRGTHAHVVDRGRTHVFIDGRHSRALSAWLARVWPRGLPTRARLNDERERLRIRVIVGAWSRIRPTFWDCVTRSAAFVAASVAVSYAFVEWERRRWQQ